jgi:hypothetical protein
MPTTPNYAIPYPCSGDVIDPDVFAAWAQGIDAAIADVDLLASQASTRPSLSVRTAAGGQAIATGVATDLTFTALIFGEGVSFTAPSTTVTITEAGLYRVTGQMTNPVNVTTVTRFRIIVNASTGRRVSRNTAFTTPRVSGLPIQASGLFVAPVGTTFTVNAQWVGTGGPMSIAGMLNLTKICDL